MKRYVTSQFAKRGDVLLLEISESTEAVLRANRGGILGQEQEWLVNEIRLAIEDGEVTHPLVILTAVDLRRRVREAIEIEYPHVAVLCREELDEGIFWSIHRYISLPEA